MKNLELNKIGISAVGLAVVLGLMAAVLSFTLPDQRYHRYNIAFPDTAGGRSHHEWRLLPYRDSVRDRAHLIIQELLLGPVKLGAVPFLPEGTTVRSVIYDREDETVYVDFSFEFVVEGTTGTISFEEALSLVQNNITRNISRIEEIVITVEGQLPGVPRFDTL